MKMKKNKNDMLIFYKQERRHRHCAHDTFCSFYTNLNICSTMPNFVAIDKTVAEIWPFFDFFFQNVEILGAGRLKTAKMRHRAKFRGDRLNRCRDMAIFRFLKMAAAAILDF